MAKSEEGMRQGREPAGPQGLDSHAEHLRSVPSFQMQMKDRCHVNIPCSF